MAKDAHGNVLNLGDLVYLPCKIVELQEDVDGNNNLQVETSYRAPRGTSHRVAINSAQVELDARAPRLEQPVADPVPEPVPDPPPPPVHNEDDDEEVAAKRSHHRR